MSAFIEVRALAGAHYVKPSAVIAVQHGDAGKCTVVLTGGVTLSCAEPASQVRSRIDAALELGSEPHNGHASL